MKVGQKEMERTCKRDGTVWYVSLDVAKARPPGRLETLGLKMQVAGDNASLGRNKRTTAAIELGRLDARAQRVAQAGSCPTCGSSAFKERKVKT